MSTAAEKREETAAVKSYLEWVSRPKPKGRPVTREMLAERIAKIDQDVAEADVLRRLDLLEQRRQLSQQMVSLQDRTDGSELEEQFVKVARSYADRKGISYKSWRAAGVPAATLKRAGIALTRDR